ncbi:hypothetical protein NPIL_594321 [Nephila pilipes]|uniref:Uncharacterized protein n=1 Tax=Nephila pilipes TaxID=299642 RepID=A0A8X6PG82_NEPPI|nr:hypothetical protein NPIL_594321 [Nephila pilipes]
MLIPNGVIRNITLAEKSFRVGSGIYSMECESFSTLCSFKNSKNMDKRKNTYEINICFVHVIRAIGQSHARMTTSHRIMNFPPSVAEEYYDNAANTLRKCTKITEASKHNAAMEEVAQICQKFLPKGMGH